MACRGLAVSPPILGLSGATPAAQPHPDKAVDEADLCSAGPSLMTHSATAG